MTAMRFLSTLTTALFLVHGSFLAAEEPVAQPIAVEIVKKLDVVYVQHGDRAMHLDLFIPVYEADSKPAIVVVHGGGWLKGDKMKFHPLAEALARYGFVTAAVEYRLGGEAKFPAAIHDCNAATAWLRSNAKAYSVDPERIAAVGGSAGGHLVGLMATGSDVDELRLDSSPSTAIKAAVVLAGPMELATGPVAEKSRNQPNASNSNKWLGKTVDEAPDLYELTSPFSHASAKTPPMLFMAGEFDLPERNLATREKLREAGVPAEILAYGEGKHGCWNREPWRSIMVADMAAFIGEHVGHDFTRFVHSTRDMPWGTAEIDAQGITLSVDQPRKEASLSIPRLNNPVPEVEGLSESGSKKTTIKPGVETWAIALPEGARRIRLTTIDPPQFTSVPPVMSQAEDGSLTLPAHRAVIHGKTLRYEPQPHKNTIGYWANPADWCEWKVYVEHPGDFEVSILQGCGKGHGGSEVDVILGEQKLAFTVEDTGHFQNFKERSIGSFAIDSPGIYDIQIRPRNKAKGAVMDVRQMRLVPRG